MSKRLCERQQVDRATEGPMSRFSAFQGPMKRKSPNELYSWDAEQEKEKQNRHHCVRHHRCDEIEDGPMNLRGAIVDDIEILGLEQVHVIAIPTAKSEG